MKEDEAKAWVVLIAMVIVAIGIIVVSIQIGIIHFHQTMFWISLFVLSPVFLIASLFFFIWGIFFYNGGNKDWGYYQEPDFFTRGVIFLFAGGLLVLTLLTFFIFMPNQYNKGYSDEVLQRLAELEDQKQSLEQIQSILTGQIVWDIQNQVLEETITSLCKDPNYPCDSVKQSYQVYKDLKGAKDEADKIVNFLGFIEKIDNTQRDINSQDLTK